MRVSCPVPESLHIYLWKPTLEQVTLGTNGSGAVHWLPTVRGFIHATLSSSKHWK